MKRFLQISILPTLILIFGCKRDRSNSFALYECIQKQLIKEDQLSSIQKLLLYDFVINGKETASFQELNDRFNGQLITKINGQPIEVFSRFDGGILSLKQIVKLKNGKHQVLYIELSQEGLIFYRNKMIPCKSD